MGKVRANNALTVVRGKVGELSFAHYQDGRIIVRKAGGPKSNFTPAQLRHQERMARAVLFRKFIKTSPAAYAIYKNEARIRRKRACDLVISDYLSAPVIRDIDASEYSAAADQIIRIEAFDSFLVTQVSVAIKTAAGNLLEEGQAVLEENAPAWIYRTQHAAVGPQTLTITVSASDPAGNCTTKTHHHEVSAAPGNF